MIHVYLRKIGKTHKLYLKFTYRLIRNIGQSLYNYLIKLTLTRQYSQTCEQRPPKGKTESGLLNKWSLFGGHFV